MLSKCEEVLRVHFQHPGPPETQAWLGTVFSKPSACARVRSDAGSERASFFHLLPLPSTAAGCFFHRFFKRSRV